MANQADHLMENEKETGIEGSTGITWRVGGT